MNLCFSLLNKVRRMKSASSLINDITSPSVQLVLLPLRAAAYEIRIAKIEGVSFIYR